MIVLLHPVHQRLAELSIISLKRNLFHNEESEFKMCLRLNEKMAWEHAKITNLSLLAHELDDHDWQHEICARVEKLEGSNKL